MIMKKLIFIFVVLMLSIVGCSQKDVVDFDNNSKLTVEERVGDTNDYEIIKVIEDEETVQKIIDIFKGVKWDTNTDREMATEPEFRLNSYDIWVTPNGDRLEIMNRNNSYYVSLSVEDSETLYEIMTGKELR